MPVQKYTHFACIADKTELAQHTYRLVAEQLPLCDMGEEPEKVDVILVLGGDGFMLETLHRYMQYEIPFYGLNCGTVGFLMNQRGPEQLTERIRNAQPATLYPLAMFARTMSGDVHRALAINEVSLLREARQAAKIRVAVNHVTRIPEMVCDGALVSTPAGSTAYNYSAGGPILPLSANLIALTPLSVFRPRRWRGALLPHASSVYFEIIHPQKRPVSAVADFTEVRDVVSVEVSEHPDTAITLLFDPERHLGERMIDEQFFQ